MYVCVCVCACVCVYRVRSWWEHSAMRYWRLRRRVDKYRYMHSQRASRQYYYVHAHNRIAQLCVHMMYVCMSTCYLLVADE